MPASLRVVLSEESDRTLRELRAAVTVPQRIKERLCSHGSIERSRIECARHC